jgi:hypothetical protein
MYAPEGYKAVCYRCSYESSCDERRCPVCHFPFIMERETTPPGGRRIEGILNRASVDGGAPPLPGVHAEKRVAQLAAESRRKRETERLIERREKARALTAEVAAERQGGTTVAAARGGLGGKLAFAFLCVSADAAGALASVFHVGL